VVTNGETSHVAVLRQEVVGALAGSREPGILLDATLGAGGHAERLLEATQARLVGVDRDPVALRVAAERLARFGARVTLVHGSFRDLGRILESSGGPVDGLVADLGVSSMQLDDPARGFSLRAHGPLDMRMDPTSGAPLSEVLSGIDAESLADALYALSDERRSRAIARSILAARDAGRLHTTADLADAIRRASGPRRGPIDPATRSFQALRMLVNEEVAELDSLLAALPSLLAPGGRAAVVSFHSVEDRRVKQAFRSNPALSPLTKKPIRPSEAEIAGNPRARSGKLRVARRVDA
jgi:16S rRNA (cytosine1402-N4)-methyltransferase